MRQAENGTPVGEVCRKVGISEQTFYRWKRKYAGIGIAAAFGWRRLLVRRCRHNDDTAGCRLQKVRAG